MAVAATYAAGRDDTLIIVTADHETGGMAVSETDTGASGQDGPFDAADSGIFYVTWARTGHTDTDVPITAQGPMADRFSGIHDNTFIYDVMRLSIMDDN